MTNQGLPRRALSIFDSSCIIVGIIVGVGIYEISPMVAGSLSSWTLVLGFWMLGGFLSLTGALCYAELASAYPRAGGDYVYLGRAYGPWAGYLFAWSQMFVIRPGDIALLAFVFSRYAQQIFPGKGILYASIAVVALTIINLIGLQAGKWTQNVLTIVKIVGLLAIVGAAFLAPSPEAPPAPPEGGGFELALILVLFAYGGWSEMAYVAAEVKDPNRNIVRALVAGTLFVTAVYVLVNGAFISALGHGGMAGSKAVAVDAVKAALPEGAAKAIAVLICLSALGATNGLILTGARISYAMGVDHPPFTFLGKWNERRGAPVRSLILQGVLALVIILAFGSFIDAIFFTTPIVWIFFLATGVSVFVLRKRDPDTPRPYKITGYPITPILFCACCVFLLYASVSFALMMEYYGPLVAAGVILLGVIAYALTRKRA